VIHGYLGGIKNGAELSFLLFVNNLTALFVSLSRAAGAANGQIEVQSPGLPETFRQLKPAVDHVMDQHIV